MTTPKYISVLDESGAELARFPASTDGLSRVRSMVEPTIPRGYTRSPDGAASRKAHMYAAALRTGAWPTGAPVARHEIRARLLSMLSDSLAPKTAELIRATLAADRSSQEVEV